MQSSQWVGEQSSRPRKHARVSKKIKVMVVVSDWKDIVHQEFIPRGEMVNKAVYQGILARLWDAVSSRKPELWETQT